MDCKNKGITLVALVVTIIILLMLSGISIAQLTGTGLFEKAKEAKRKYSNLEELENEKLEEYESEINKTILGTRDDLPSTTIYPNGTEDEPSTISANQRIEIQNPYPGKNLYLVVQVFYKEVWGETGFIYADGGWGIKATQIQGKETDKIVIQSGRKAILSGSYDSGNGFGTDVNPSTAPYRLKIFCLD